MCSAGSELAVEAQEGPVAAGGLGQAVAVMVQVAWNSSSRFLPLRSRDASAQTRRRLAAAGSARVQSAAPLWS